MRKLCTAVILGFIVKYIGPVLEILSKNRRVVQF